MKKVLMVLLGAMLVLSMAGMVSADTDVGVENLTSNQHIVEVSVTVGLEQSFTVTIPDSINLNDDVTPGTYSGYDTLSATVHLLNPNTKLVVRISSDNVDNHQYGQSNYWILKDSANHELQYIIASTSGAEDHVNEQANGNWVYEGMEVISLTGPTTVTKHLHFKVKSGQFSEVPTGDYSDLLKFTVSLEEITPTTP